MKVAAAAAVAAVGLGLTVAACGDDDAGIGVTPAGAVAADYDFVIPAGTGDRIDAGEPIEILPAEMKVKVGEVIRIANRDDRGYAVGPFFVGAGETVVQRFSRAGEYAGDCAVHPSGQLILHVER